LIGTGDLVAVAAGALAVLVIVDGDPLKDLGLLQDQGARIPMTMKGGDCVKMELKLGTDGSFRQ